MPSAAKLDINQCRFSQLSLASRVMPKSGSIWIIRISSYFIHWWEITLFVTIVSIVDDRARPLAVHMCIEPRLSFDLTSQILPIPLNSLFVPLTREIRNLLNDRKPLTENVANALLKLYLELSRLSSFYLTILG